MDTLFSHVNIVTMNEQMTLWQDAFVGITDGKIAYMAKKPPEEQPKKIIDATGMVLMPGLINCHTHLPMYLLRGYADDLNLQDWLEHYIFPREDRLDGRCVRAATTLAVAECLKFGVTSVSDMYYFCDDICDVIAKSGYEAMLKAMKEEGETRRENLGQLVSSIKTYADQNGEDATLSGFLEEVALISDLDSYDNDADSVTMMTIHSAKGLEFPYVFVIGMEDGIFPGDMAKYNEEDMEEERRLCYVAITRAKQTLNITYARQRMLYGRTTTNIPSRFVDELPEEFVEKRGGFKPRPERSYDEVSQVGGYGGGYSGQKQRAPRPPRKDYSSLTGAAPKQANIQFAKGDMIQHKAFGRGMILTVLPMGNDALLEIAFDGIGTKRLMANTASQHMTKL